MKTNSICCFIALIALFAFAGCSDGQYQKSTAAGQDPGAAEDDSGGLFGEQPGTDEGIPLEDDAAAEGEKKEASPAPKATVIKPVEITKKSGDLGTCVIGEECKKTLWAKGGTGEFVWTIEGNLPKGVGFDSKNNKATIKTIEGQEIDEVGEFAFTLRVEDKADPTRSAERKFTLKVEENIAMVLYTMAEDNEGKQNWVAVEEKDKDGKDVPITVPPKGFLLVEVIGHADSYTWSINGEEIVCGGDDQACKGTKDGLTLYRDTELSPPEPHPEHFQYMILKAEENFIGTAVKNVVIAAKQDYGDPVSKTISSITFEQEPCKIQLVVTGGGNITAKKDGSSYSYDASFTVTGGLKPYYWRENESSWNQLTNNTFELDGSFFASGLTLKKIKEGPHKTRTITIKDSCNTPRETTVTLNVSIPLDDDMIDRVSDLRIKMDVTDVNDTSSNGETYLVIKIKSKAKELGRFSFDLDACGDSGYTSNCEDVRTIKVADGEGDHLITEIDEISLQFHDEECWFCGDLDCDLITIDFMTKNWETRYYDNKSEGGYGNDDDVVDDEWGPKQDLVPKIMAHEGVSDVQDIWKSRTD